MGPGAERLKPLKTIRRVIAVGTLFFFSLLFLDLNGSLPGDIATGILYFQFIPSLLKFLSNAGLLTAGFVLVLIMTLLGGRVYCSFLCPLGISTDVISRLSSQKMKRKNRYSKPHSFLRYSILILTIGSLFSGTMVVVNILDPYSSFGRIMALIIKPVFAMFNNGLSRILEMMDIYSVTPYAHHGFPLSVYIFVSLFMLLILILAVWKGRLYCNTLCPVGTLLGLFSKVSFLKLHIDPNSCTTCGRCERKCKSSCIDSNEKYIDLSRCVACYNCINTCPENSIGYMKNRKSATDSGCSESLNHQRRAFMALAALVMTGFSKTAFAAKRPVVYVMNKIRVKREYPITPPGSRSIANFTNKCTACYLCVTACPGKVIQPYFAGFGGKGVLMPAMLNKYGYCNFNCTRCSEVCPTGAILPVKKEEKKQIQIGKVVFIRENCIVITQKTECGACSEHCPTKAVYMVVENRLRVPAVKPDICVGCGACEYACPAIPFKAIYVEGNPVHLTAEKPKVKKLKQPEGNQDFMF